MCTGANSYNLLVKTASNNTFSIFSTSKKNLFPIIERINVAGHSRQVWRYGEHPRGRVALLHLQEGVETAGAGEGDLDRDQQVVGQGDVRHHQDDPRPRGETQVSRIEAKAASDRGQHQVRLLHVLHGSPR